MPLANVGFVNYAERTTFQLGFVNATKHLDGLQIGLANYAENGIFPILPPDQLQEILLGTNSALAFRRAATTLCSTRLHRGNRA